MTPIVKIATALVAGASFFAWQPVQAQCSTAAWTSVAGSASAGSAPAVRRYSGACGLTATMPGGGHVVEATNHANEGVSAPFRARFFVFPAITSGNVVVFQAMDADSAGNALVQVRYDAAAQRFDFINSVGTVRSTSVAAPPSKWYRVSVEYQANSGTGFNASVTGNGGQAITLAGGALPTTNVGVQAVRLGAVSGTAPGGSVFVDEYEASRAAMATANPYSVVCRGDANKDGNLNVFDTIQIINERLNGTLTIGQPDCNEDGTVNVFDTICVIGRRLASDTCN
jgi:hypothetical protein